MVWLSFSIQSTRDRVVATFKFYSLKLRSIHTPRIAIFVFRMFDHVTTLLETTSFICIIISVADWQITRVGLCGAAHIRGSKHISSLGYEHNNLQRDIQK